MDKAIDAYRAHCDALVAEGKVPNLCCAIMKDGKVIFEHSAGNDSLSLTTPIRVYSMTKVVTAVAILQLRDAGKLSLDTEIKEILEEWRIGLILADTQEKIENKITIRHLLQHTAGFSYGFWLDTVADMYRKENLNLPHPIAYPELDDPSSRRKAPSSLDDFSARLATQAVLFEAGDRYHYSVSFDLLGHIIERVSGLSLDTYFRKHIFDRVGASQLTNFYLTHPNTLAPIYVKEDDRFILAPHLDPAPNALPAALSGGGGLYSTIADWLAFSHGLLSGTLLSKASLDDLRAPDTSDFIRPDDSLAKRYPALGLGVWCYPPAEKNQNKSAFHDDDYPGVPSASVMAPGSFGWPGVSGSSFFIDPAHNAALVFTTHLFLASLIVPDLQTSLFKKACDILKEAP